ncbi:hypothetical protein [Nocardiopsis sp. CC223A]|uniref:hypothetical protein n=1 Tax=Nocardiopsis sp. CC223A TaxID=3044051 RepID=UPI002795B755|nr:hypothetical protein [Nocardiopsis sp. CC223A]
MGPGGTAYGHAFTPHTVTPVARVCDGDRAVGDGTPGPVTPALRDALLGVRTGRAPDPRGRLRPVPAA